MAHFFHTQPDGRAPRAAKLLSVDITRENLPVFMRLGMILDTLGRPDDRQNSWQKRVEPLLTYISQYLGLHNEDKQLNINSAQNTIYIMYTLMRKYMEIEDRNRERLADFVLSPFQQFNGQEEQDLRTLIRPLLIDLLSGTEFAGLIEKTLHHKAAGRNTPETEVLILEERLASVILRAILGNELLSIVPSGEFIDEDMYIEQWGLSSGRDQIIELSNLFCHIFRSYTAPRLQLCYLIHHVNIIPDLDHEIDLLWSYIDGVSNADETIGPDIVEYLFAYFKLQGQEVVIAGDDRRPYLISQIISKVFGTDWDKFAPIIVKAFYPDPMQYPSFSNLDTFTIIPAFLLHIQAYANNIDVEELFNLNAFIELELLEILHSRLENSSEYEITAGINCILACLSFLLVFLNWGTGITPESLESQKNFIDKKITQAREEDPTFPDNFNQELYNSIWPNQ